MPPQDFTIDPKLPTLDDKAALQQQLEGRSRQQQALGQMFVMPRSGATRKTTGSWVPAPGTGSRRARNFNADPEDALQRLSAHTNNVLRDDVPDPFKDVSKRFGFNR